MGGGESSNDTWCLSTEAHLALNMSGCVLCVFKLLHQRNVSQKIAMGCGEPVQQIILQPLKLDFEVVLLHGQLHLGNKTN